MKKLLAFLLLASLGILACGMQASVLPVVTATQAVSTSTNTEISITPAKFQGQISTQTPQTVKTTVGAVWVRSEPSGAKLYALPTGSEVRVIECRPDGWCRIYDGWLWAGCLGLQNRECRGE